MKKNKKITPFLSPLSWAEVDLKAIKHNLREVRKICKRPGLKSTQILAVVKADAYGHGMFQVAGILEKAGVDFFGVSNIEEGVALRGSGIKSSILLFESTMQVHAKSIVDFKLTPTVCTLEFASILNRIGKLKRKKVDIHIKVDTGMGRLGVWHKDAVDFIGKVSRLSYLSIKGIYTHFPSADTDRKFTGNQINQLYKTVKDLDEMALIVPYVHAANSMGLIGYKTRILNLARLGLMLYGLYPDKKIRSKISLKPALSIRSKIVFIKKISKGRSVSYGRTFIAKRNMTVATLSIGYNDGYLRAFSNKAFVLVGGVRCPVLGRVTMNEVVVDISKVRSAKLGMTVTVLGKEKGKSVTADELGGYAKTINYEIVCGFGNRLPRIYKK